MTKKSIAQAFSLGKFDTVLSQVSRTITWNVVGEHQLEGKEAVEMYCAQVGSYFQSVETNFQILDTIQDEYRVVITGTAEFKRDGRVVNTVQSCDVYIFNKEQQIERITSYCIQGEKDND